MSAKKKEWSRLHVRSFAMIKSTSKTKNGSVVNSTSTCEVPLASTPQARNGNLHHGPLRRNGHGRFALGSEPAKTDRTDDLIGNIAIIGLGYVGLPLALQFARTGSRVIGLDIDPAKTH